MQSVCFQHAKAHIIRTCIVYSAISFFPTCKRTHTTHPHNFIGWELRTAIGRETPTWLTHQSRQTIPQPFFAWKYIQIKTLQGRLAQNFSFCETSKSLRFGCSCSKDHLYFPKISILFSQIWKSQQVHFNDDMLDEDNLASRFKWKTVHPDANFLFYSPMSQMRVFGSIKLSAN